MIIKARGSRFVVYRSVRQGKRVRTQYVGSGLAALGMLERDLDARIEAARERDQDRKQDRALDAWSRAIEQFVRAMLVIAGYHRHHRGEWRRRTMNQITTGTPDQPIRHPLSPNVEAIRSRVAAGDFNLTSDDARKLIRAMPEAARIVKNPAVALRDTLIDRYYGHVLEREAIRYQVEQVQADLAGPSPTAMESLLAERAAISWLAVNVYEKATESAKDLTLAGGVYRQRQIDAAHRRFLSAIRTLATVRKLALPDLKITLNQRSVHVRNSMAGPPDCDIVGRAIEVGSESP